MKIDKIAVTIIIILYGSVVFGQQPDSIKQKSHREFLLGVEAGKSAFGYSFGGEAGFTSKKHYLFARFIAGNEKYHLPFEKRDSLKPNQKYMDLGIYYNWIFRSKHLAFYIGPGISVMKGTRIEKSIFNSYGPYSSYTDTIYLGTDFIALGFSIDTRLLWMFNEHFGIGLKGFVNYNPQKVNHGIMINIIYSGLFRRKKS